MDAPKKPFILYIKNNTTNQIEPSKQTANLREKTNSKIRMLGNKYYEIKGILERLNIHRDTLFISGKEIETIFKNNRRLTPLQNQYKRLKESLYCWFAENFYQEIIHQDEIICRIIKSAHNYDFLTKLKINSNHIVKNKNIRYDNPEKKKKEIKKELAILNNGIIGNTEIDNFYKDDIFTNKNFDFNKYFDF